MKIAQVFVDVATSHPVDRVLKVAIAVPTQARPLGPRAEAYKRIWPCTECDSCKEGTPFKNRLKTRLLVRFSGSTDSM